MKLRSGRQTYNARTETVAAKPGFRDAWKNAQHCIIPVDEKRMVVILPPDSYDPWLKATPQLRMDFMRQYPAERLLAGAESPAQRSLLA